MNEAETIDHLIRPALVAAGWTVVEGSRIRREYPITLGRIEGRGRRAKALKADIVLEYRNTKLAVVEAKSDEKPPGVRQFASKNSYFLLHYPSVYAGFRPHFWKCM